MGRAGGMAMKKPFFNLLAITVDVLFTVAIIIGLAIGLLIAVTIKPFIKR